MNITFANGDEMEVVSDQTWTGRDGSILHDGVYNGETYDSRRDRLGWAQVGFNDSLSTWIMPEILPSPVNVTPSGVLSLQDMPPIRAGPDALHLETTAHKWQQGYLKREDMTEVKGGSLTDGGIIKPINKWKSESGETFSLKKYTTRIHFGTNFRS